MARLAGRRAARSARWSATESGNGSYVAYIGVVEAARGRGVAKNLLRTIVADAAARGRDRVGLEVDADSSTGAHHLYESMGWTTSYVTESWHRDVPWPEPRRTTLTDTWWVTRPPRSRPAACGSRRTRCSATGSSLGE